MTAVALAHRLPRLRRTRSTLAVVPPLSERLQIARAALVVICVLAGGLLLQLTVVSAAEQRASQQQLYDRFRAELAAGTAPVGPTDQEGRELPIGAPVSYLEIPSIGLRQVVVEGTTSGALLNGPGHRRDSPLPGQVGVSVILGRKAAFGGPFARIDDLEEGADIRITTGQGEFDFTVLGVRREGDPVPPPVDGDGSRIVLATADGRRLIPSGVVRVDAELDREAQPGPRRLVSAGALPAAEQMMGSDSSRLWLLALWMEVLIALAVGFLWAWHRWGRAQAWIVSVPPLLLVSLFASDQVALLLPNLL